MRRTVHTLVAIGCMLAVALVLWALRHLITGDLAAFAGVFIIWLAGAAGAGWYVVSGLKVVYDAPEKLEPIRAGMDALPWPWMTAFLIGPGVWIGLVARSPLLVAVSCLLVFMIIGRLNEVVPSRVPLASGPRPAITYLRPAFTFGVILLAATVVGLQIREWLRW